MKTGIEKHLEKDKNLQILKHVKENPHGRQISNFDCFDVIDQDNSHFRLQLKEAEYITWKKPNLNKQIKHVTISVQVILFFTFFSSFYFTLLFSFSIVITFHFHSSWTFTILNKF